MQRQPRGHSLGYLKVTLPKRSAIRRSRAYKKQEYSHVEIIFNKSSAWTAPSISISIKNNFSAVSLSLVGLASTCYYLMLDECDYDTQRVSMDVEDKCSLHIRSSLSV